MSTRPKCKLIGEDGNIFNLIGVAERTLKKEGMKREAEIMREKVFRSESYEEALAIICEYVDPI